MLYICLDFKVALVVSRIYERVGLMMMFSVTILNFQKYFDHRKLTNNRGEFTFDIFIFSPPKKLFEKEKERKYQLVL